MNQKQLLAVKTLIQEINNAKSTDEIVKILSDKPSINKCLATYNAISLQNGKYVVNDGKSIKPCPLSELKDNAVSNIHDLAREFDFQANATPEQKEARKAREALDEQRMKQARV